MNAYVALGVVAVLWIAPLALLVAWLVRDYRRQPRVEPTHTLHAVPPPCHVIDARSLFEARRAPRRGDAA